jgi:hypothetical protein
MCPRIIYKELLDVYKELLACLKHSVQQRSNLQKICRQKLSGDTKAGVQMTNE